MSFKSLTKALHDVVLEEAPETEPTTKVSAPAPVAAPVAFHEEVSIPTASVTGDASAIYGILLERTDFASTPMHQTIHKYTEAMKSAPLDDNTKLKIAFAQATQLDHVTPDMVRKAFATLKQHLTVKNWGTPQAIGGK